MANLIDISQIKKAIKPKADSTLNNMRKSELIEYIRCLENNYNASVWFNENQARYIESLNSESLRPKGEWIEWYPPKHMIMTGEELLYRCSCCDAKSPDVEGYKFCPYCGAAMRGSENDG